VETLASGTAIGREGRLAAESDPDSVLATMLAEGHPIDGRAVTEAALGGDPTAIAVFDLIGTRLGVALVSFANSFEPKVIVVGGGAMAAGDLLLDPARRTLRERALRPMNETPVAAAALGPDAGMIGAAAMARIELEKGGG
jgi:glucokinase